MSQISPPIRILLVAAVGLIAAWMLFLKPSGGSTTTPTTPAASSSTPTAPGVKGLTRAIDKAHSAASAQEKSDAAVQAATGGDVTAKGAATKSAPAASPAVEAARKAVQGNATAKVDTHDLPLSVLKAVAQRKVMVLLFWNPESADDRAVKAAVDKADRWNGEVFFHTAPIKSISDYGRISRGADVEQSPTIVVVDRNLGATRLVGYVDTQTIDQAVVDARRGSGVLVSGAYLRSVNKLCSQMGVAINTSDLPGKPSEVSTFLTGASASMDRFGTRFAALKAPARFHAFKAAASADLKSYTTGLRGWGRYLGPHPTQARALTSIQRYVPALSKSATSFNARMDKQHLLACGSQG